MKVNIVSDMDGVIYRGGELIPGADKFVQTMIEKEMKFLFLTNNSEQTAIDLKRKLEGLGINGVTEDNFITSAMATAKFLSSQSSSKTAYIIGGGGLASELYKEGFSITEKSPEYVVVGKTNTLNFEMLKKAVTFITTGSKFIATNPDVIDPVENGIEPACGAIVAAIETATGKKPYIVGKPNALMMMIAKYKLGVHASETVMVGDRMDTDVVSGMEAGMRTCLVLSGVSDRNIADSFPYRPDFIFDDVGKIDFDLLERTVEENKRNII